MTTELKYTLLRLAKVFRGGPEVYINKIDEDLADEIEEMLKVSTPKYDPCRLFKAGDIVEPCSVNGRWCTHTWKDRSGIHYEVTKDEDPLTAHMEVKDPDSPHPFLVHAAFFKLVTPVEELEPFYIIDDDCNPDFPFFVIQNRNSKLDSGLDEEVARFVYGTNYTQDYETVRKRAVAECARLNAEYRKEQK